MAATKLVALSVIENNSTLQWDAAAGHSKLRANLQRVLYSATAQIRIKWRNRIDVELAQTSG